MAESAATMPPGDQDGIHEHLDWEFVVFEALEAGIQITVQGIARAGDVQLLPELGGVAVVGSWSPALRQYRVQCAIDGAGGTVVGERTTAHVHGLRAGDLPVVVTDDPTHPDLPAAFLHQRADRWVLMGDIDSILVA